MSKIGKINISIPDKVKVVLNGSLLNIEGPHGKKTLNMDLDVFDLKINDGKDLSIKPKVLNKDTAWVLGFVMFFLLYGVIYKTFLAGKYVFDNQIIFWSFVVFWLFYGVFYKTEEETKNVGYNVLDLFSKCFVGLFFWAYLTKVIVIF